MNDTSTRIVELSGGPVEYWDSGAGPVIVFVHGVFVDARLWRHVVAELAGEFRCVAPTWPIGAHRIAMRPEADLSPVGLARLIGEFMDALDLSNVTLVGNDTGGALCQLLIAQGHERVANLVLSNCDAFECFPPRILAPLYALSRVPGFLRFLARALNSPFARAKFFATVARAAADDALLASMLRPMLEDPGVRRDLEKTLSAVSQRDTLSAAQRFGDFAKPVRVVWGTSDLFFPVTLGERLARAFQDGRFERVEGARTFLPEDAPMILASSIRSVVAKAIA